MMTKAGKFKTYLSDLRKVFEFLCYNLINCFAVLPSSALQGFFFAHFPLFDSHVYRLRLAIERACHSRNSFAMQVTEVTFTEKSAILYFNNMCKY